MEEQLISLGLTPAQAQTYLYLLKQGKAVKPTKVATEVQQTRTNTYKLLDTLLELGLVTRSKDKATFVYTAEDPGALTNLSQRKRNEAIRLEKRVKEVLPKLKELHVKSEEATNVKARRGKRAVYEAHMRHAKRAGDMHFILSQSDIPLLSYELMRKIRHAPFDLGSNRFGITQDVPGAPKNPAIDARTGLTRTWIDRKEYKAPVEWSVHGGELLIVDYSGEGEVVSIKNETIADAFTQLWTLIDTQVRSRPGYKNLPLHAEREV